MTDDFAMFGKESKFAIHARWLTDRAAPAERPKGHGWSLGELQIYVGGQHVTASRRSGTKSGVRWYLSVFAHWLANNWAPLLHEERFPWGAQPTLPGNLAINATLRRFLTDVDDHGSAIYAQAQSWWRRHSMASIDDGGLWPDLCLRRFGDLIEISWSNRKPAFAPGDFSFEFLPGISRLPVRAVAEPLWEFLAWVASTGPTLEHVDQGDVRSLENLLVGLDRIHPGELERWYASTDLMEKARLHHPAPGDVKAMLFSDRLPNPPIVEELAPAVAMFGAVSPETTVADIEQLTDILLGARGGEDTAELHDLVADADLRLGMPAHVQGGELAGELLEWCEGERWLTDAGSVDMGRILQRLRISEMEVALETDSVRGMAIAGAGFQPTVVVNTHHPFNEQRSGQRFTLAHELCHVLHDRGRSRRVSHASTPWTNPAIERRANAFAAMLLMPPRLVEAAISMTTSPRGSLAWARAVARLLGSGVSATIEHLSNLELINPDERSSLRDQYDGAFR